MPRPGTPVIDPRLAAHNAPTIEGTRTATGSVTRGNPGAGTFDPATGHTTYPGAAVIYSGPLRVQQLTLGGSDATFGDQQVTLTQARISLPLAVEPAVDDHILITASSDPQLTGLRFRVLQNAQSSVTWQRDVIAEVNRG